MMTTTLDSVIFKSSKPVGVKIPTVGIYLPPTNFAYGKKEPTDKEDASISIVTFIQLLEVGNITINQKI